MPKNLIPRWKVDFFCVSEPPRPGLSVKGPITKIWRWDLFYLKPTWILYQTCLPPPHIEQVPVRTKVESHHVESYEFRLSHQFGRVFYSSPTGREHTLCPISQCYYFQAVVCKKVLFFFSCFLFSGYVQKLYNSEEAESKKKQQRAMTVNCICMIDPAPCTIQWSSSLYNLVSNYAALVYIDISMIFIVYTKTYCALLRLSQMVVYR